MMFCPFSLYTKCTVIGKCQSRSIAFAKMNGTYGKFDVKIALSLSLIVHIVNFILI